MANKLYTGIYWRYSIYIMKYLYVLTSTQRDNYYEQFFLSLTSLKLLMPNAHTILLCDSKTKETLTGKRAEYEKLISELLSINVPETFSHIETSRWLKTSMRNHVQGDFLYIDCDTIISEDLSSIFKLDINFGACLDCHSPLSSHANKDLFVNCDKKLDFSSYLSDKYYNGGIIYCSDTPQAHKILDRWHELWLYSRSKKILRDMPSLNMAIHENFQYFTELNGIWNCQLIANYLPFLVDAKILHYFATNLIFYSSPFLFASENIFNDIKENGVISKKILKLLKNPKTSFISQTRVFSGNEMLHVLDSDLFKSLYFMHKKTPLIFKFFNNVSSSFKKLIKNNLIKKNKKKNSVERFYN